MAHVSEIYGSMVFNEHVMKERLPSATYKSLTKTIKEGKPLDIEVANVVAHAMKEWAIEHGATHYTHWFQPLSGITSEKHDSFLNPVGDGTAIMTFSGKELIQGEPDASSFPSGGLRATFEARGYTAWDPTSYAFIKDEVLCIPTAFCSYTGEALDKKTPLLRSMSAVNEQAQRVLKFFGEDGHRVVSTVGAEQEYFLISEKDYVKRQDLVMTGRTLFGAAPLKGQELEEHYFGAIRPTVNEFMKEVDDDLWALGVSAKTKHNEVAPAQHELAPLFTNSNRAIDENLLTMEKMRLDASHHGLVCLQHEKPFEGINGSGKHNNWSLSYDKVNLLDPGDDPMDNLRFLAKFMKDNTDRNRTSPFAFTGNKFEFRMPGSSVNLSDCNMILNTAMAKSLKGFADALDGAEGADFEKKAIAYIKKTLTDHQRIIFNGNGYSEEWEKEAEKRGLANHRNTAEALPCFVDQKSLDLFDEFNVLTEPEVRSRYEVKLDKYNKLLNIEARTMIRMVRRTYLPAITDYMADLASDITTVKAAISGADMTETESVLEVIVTGVDKAAKATRELIKVHNAAEAIEAPQEQANAYANEVIPAMDTLRAEIDALECVVERDYWPVPTYNDILFYA